MTKDYARSNKERRGNPTTNVTIFSVQSIEQPYEEIVHTVGFIKTQRFKDPLLSY